MDELRAARPVEMLWAFLRYFGIYRILVAVLLLGITYMDEGAVSLGSRSPTMFRAVCVAYVVLGVMFYGVLQRRPDRFNLQLSVHVLLDIAVITLLVNASGGISSGLGVMVLISLIAAALVAPPRLAFLYPSVAAIATLIEQGYWVLIHDAPTANFLQPGLLSIGYFASAGVTGWLVQRMAANELLANRRGRELGAQIRINQLVIEDMHDGVVVLDRGGTVVQHNPQALRMVGVQPLIGEKLAVLLPGLSNAWQTWRAGTNVSEPVSVDVDAREKGIRARMLDAGGEDEGFSVLFLEDITRSREQAQQLKLAALGRMTANIAHEIRNPLSAISHAAELLGEDRGGEHRERLARIIVDNTRRLERVVADVMQLNRRDRASVQIIDLNEWVEVFLEEFTANESVPMDRFRVRVQEGLRVAFDRDHFRQVVWNLLRNAVRYARAEPSSVEIEAHSFAGRVEVNISDNGPGVARDHRAQLFEPFFTTDSKGTGLGLFLARELCAGNYASLEYVAVEVGARFRVLCREARRP